MATSSRPCSAPMRACVCLRVLRARSTSPACFGCSTRCASVLFCPLRFVTLNPIMQVPHPEAVLKRLYDALKPGGKLLFAEPAFHVTGGKFALETCTFLNASSLVFVTCSVHVLLCRHGVGCWLPQAAASGPHLDELFGVREAWSARCCCCSCCRRCCCVLCVLCRHSISRCCSSVKIGIESNRSIYQIVESKLILNLILYFSPLFCVVLIESNNHSIFPIVSATLAEFLEMSSPPLSSAVSSSAEPVLFKKRSVKKKTIVLPVPEVADRSPQEEEADLQKIRELREEQKFTRQQARGVLFDSSSIDEPSSSPRSADPAPAAAPASGPEEKHGLDFHADATESNLNSLMCVRLHSFACVSCSCSCSLLQGEVHPGQTRGEEKAGER